MFTRTRVNKPTNMDDIMKKAKETEWLPGVTKSGIEFRWRDADNIILPNRSANKKQTKFHNIDRKVLAEISDVTKHREPLLPRSNNLSTTDKNCAVASEDTKIDVDNLADFEESIKNIFNTKMLDAPIEELNLPVRAYHILKLRKLETVKTVIEFGLNNIIKFRGVGIKTVRVVSDAIELFLSDRNEEGVKQTGEGKQQLNANLFRLVDEMELSVRSANCLRNANIKYIGELVQKSEHEMLKIRNFGRTSLNEIKEMLTNMGLDFGMKIEGFPYRKELVGKCIENNDNSVVSFEELIKSRFDEKMFNTAIEELNLSVRAFNALREASLKTIKDVINFGLHALQKRKNVGNKTINDIKVAILAIPAKLEQENKIVSFIDTVESILSSIIPKYLSAIKARYGYDNGNIETLEKIGLKAGVTRERARQIIKKEIKRIKLHKSRGIQPLIENIERLLQQHNGIISIKDMANDAYFVSGNKNQLIFLINFLAALYDDRYTTIHKNFITYLGDDEIKMLNSKIRKAALKCLFPIEEDVFLKKIMSSIGPISNDYLIYQLFYKEHIEISKGKILSIGNLSIPQRVKLLMKDIDRPMHFSEIAQLYRSHFEDSTSQTSTLEHAIHSRIGLSDDFIIIDSGTFMLRERFKIPENIEEIVRASKEILKSLKNISDTRYLINELKKRKIDIEELNEYSLKPILLEHPGFVSYRKFEIGIEGFADECERKSLGNLIYEFLVSAKKPLHAKEVWKLISRQRGFPRYAIEQRLCDESHFIKVAPATYTVKEYIEKYEEKRKTIINFAKEWIQLKNAPISAFFISEVLKATKESEDFSLGLVEHVLSTISEFIRLPNGFYDLAKKT